MDYPGERPDPHLKGRSALGDFTFERDCRTPYSESYLIIDNDRPLGRVELHFTSPIVHGTLCISDEVGQTGIRQVIRAIDQELVDVLGVRREELIIHVFEGRELGIYGDHGFDQNGNGLERI